MNVKMITMESPGRQERTPVRDDLEELCTELQQHCDGNWRCCSAGGRAFQKADQTIPQLLLRLVPASGHTSDGLAPSATDDDFKLQGWQAVINDMPS